MQKTAVTQEIFDLFHPVEGQNAVYYGRIRNGKTRTATADILKLLQRGEIVYANWKISFEDFDERNSLPVVFSKWIRGSRYYFKFLSSNLHFIDPDALITGDGEVNISFLSRLVNVHIFIDEGQWVLPSLDKTYDADAIAKMKLVLHGGHYCRSLNIITQRATNISKTTRSQINVWYRCVKAWDAFGWILFKRYAIEEMKDDMPLEFEPRAPLIEVGFFGRLLGRDKEYQVPLGQCTNYWAHKRTDPVFRAYDTHAMRAPDAIEELAGFEVYETGRLGSFRLLLGFLPSLRALWARWRDTPRAMRVERQDKAFLPLKGGIVSAEHAPRVFWAPLVEWKRQRVSKT